MEKNQKAMIIISVFLAFCIIVSVVFYGVINSDNKNLSDKESNEEVAVLTEDENSRKNILIKKVKDKYFEAGYVVEDNLEEFKVLDLVEYGYYKSKPSIRYVQVNIKYSCSNDEECVNYLVKKDYDTSYDGTFLVVLDNDEFVRFQTEENYKSNSGFVETLDVIK